MKKLATNTLKALSLKAVSVSDIKKDIEFKKEQLKVIVETSALREAQLAKNYGLQINSSQGARGRVHKMCDALVDKIEKYRQKLINVIQEKKRKKLKLIEAERVDTLVEKVDALGLLQDLKVIFIESN